MTSDISQIIKSERKGWIQSDTFDINSPREINNGYCKQFAKGVKDVFPEPRVNLQEYGYTNTYSSSAHTWIKYDGKHYDAECSNGVTNAKDLPFFKRNDINPRQSKS